MKRKERYYKDYEVQESEGLLGTRKKKTIVYKGTYYSFDASRNQVTKLKIIYLVYAVLMAIVFFLIGMLNHEASRKFYVLMPYVFMFLPIYYTMLGAIKFVRSKELMTRIEYEQSILRLKRSGLGLVILSITTMIGQLIYFVSGSRKVVSILDYMFLAGCLLIGILTQLVIQFLKRIKLIEK